jgi:hypothetical protein
VKGRAWAAHGPGRNEGLTGIVNSLRLLDVRIGDGFPTALTWIIVMLSDPRLVPAMWACNLDISHSLSLSVSPYVAPASGIVSVFLPTPLPMDVGHVVAIVLVSFAMRLFPAFSARGNVPELPISIGRIALNPYFAKLRTGTRSMHAYTIRCSGTRHYL